MRNYKYGSKGLGHEERTRIPGLQWLGVKMDDILLGGRQHLDDSQGSTGQSRQMSDERARMWQHQIFHTNDCDVS